MNTAKSLPSHKVQLPTDIESLEHSVAYVKSLLEKVAEYRGKLERGEIDEDPSIVQSVAETLATIPKLDSPQFEKLFQTHLQVCL